MEGCGSVSYLAEVEEQQTTDDVSFVFGRTPDFSESNVQAPVGVAFLLQKSSQSLLALNVTFSLRRF
jgi:hypothetical protein